MHILYLHILRFDFPLIKDRIFKVNHVHQRDIKINFMIYLDEGYKVFQDGYGGDRVRVEEKKGIRFIFLPYPLFSTNFYDSQRIIMIGA